MASRRASSVLGSGPKPSNHDRPSAVLNAVVQQTVLPPEQQAPLIRELGNGIVGMDLEVGRRRGAGSKKPRKTNKLDRNTRNPPPPSRRIP